jgi:flagellin-like hook-associated protein FlgL
MNYSAGDVRLEFTAWSDQFDPDNPPAGSTVYRADITHDADGAYTFDISGTDFNPADMNYSAGDVRLEFTAWSDQFDPDNSPAGSTVYRTDITHDADGAYTFDISGTDFNPADLNYSAGDDPLEFIAWSDQFDADNPPAGSTVYRTDITHAADGAYTFDVAETNFNPANLNYSAGDVRLEFIAWADQFDPDNPPSGSTVYRTDDELASPAFLTRLEVASPEFFTRTQVASPEFFTSNKVATPQFFASSEVGSPAFFTRVDESLASPEFFTRSAGTVSYSNSISHYERSVITDYDRREITGYSREEVAFYARNKQLRTAINISGQVERYLGETRITNNPDGSLIRAHVGWERDDNQVYINNWKTFDDRVEFGSMFQVYDTDGSYAWNGDGSDFNPANIPSITVPTPTLADMAKPDYGSFARLNGSPGNSAIKNKDDAVTVPVEQSGGQDVRDYSDTFSLDTPDVPVGLVSDASLAPPFSGAAMELFTGKVKFDDSAAFGIYHGPAVVSDQFSAEEGQFLKLNYSAAGDVDDYHVAGYIYEIDAATGNPVFDENGEPKIFMALNETGTVELNGTASVEIEASGEYRFVFVVGTFDKTGGLAAGASMKIDNIVAEFPFERDEEFIADLLKTVNYNNSDTIADDSNTFTSTIRNNGSSLVTDEVIEYLDGFNPDQMLPTLNLINTESTEVTPFEAINISVLTSKIEAVQQSLNNARVRAGSQYMALESAVVSATDLTTQYQLGYDLVHDLDFSSETAELTKKQILQQAANALLAQANDGQKGLLKMLTG